MSKVARSETQHPRRNLLNDPRVRGWLAQALVLMLLVIVAGYALYNIAHNLNKAGITTGFAFLSSPSGFDISQTLVDYSSRSTYADAFVVGILNTLLVSILGIVSSTILGFFLGIIRLSPNWLISKMAEAYTEIIRNIPLLLQILFWYLAILTPLPGPRLAMHFSDIAFLCNRGLQIPKPIFEPGFIATPVAFLGAVILSIFLFRWSKKRQLQTGRRFPDYSIAIALLVGMPLVAMMLTGFPLHWEMPVLSGFNFAGGITVLPELIALWLSLTLYSATFIGEYVRSGIMAVDKGQRDAAYALGHRPWMIYRLIVIPQAMRVVTPPLISQYLTLVKNSSLAVVIGYPDLIHVFAGTALNQSGQAVEIISITMAVYLIISLFISLIMNWYNKKYALRGL
ncbi:amino acid ABC transporter permease [Desulforhopalus sp. IMCC35007]|uniref:amino acid ABC transporter permease n=1 Tax=Desulforhopalus sp. IMCC35007 TaxID=2569543 RepID=UPI0010AE1004|nr:amino acid ABC transporter permease [Desulforhopalus sp. IMCC35007]